MLNMLASLNILRTVVVNLAIGLSRCPHDRWQLMLNLQMDIGA